MKENIRLGCVRCDREDFDGISSLPDDWTEVTQLQTLDEATRPIGQLDSGSSWSWETHIGICPECQGEDDTNG